SLGQVSTAQPSSNFLACQPLARWIVPASSRSLSSSAASSGPRGCAFFSSQARAFFRNAASCGVSSKSIAAPFGVSARRSGRGVLLLEALDQLLAPFVRRAERRAGEARAPVEEVAVVLPGEADAPVHLHHLLAGELEGVAGCDARGRRRHGQLRRVVRKRPGAVEGV